MANVLAVTSQVVYGHVGAQAGVLPLQRLGHEVWHLPTVLFSNHPAHGGYAGQAISADLLRDLLRGLDTRGFLAQVEAVLSGYLGTPENALFLAETIGAFRQAGQAIVYCCDPVLGDDGQRYVVDGLLECFRDRLIPMADIVAPNRFELGLLTGRTLETLADVIDAGERLRSSGAGIVICTSAAIKDKAITNIALTPEGNFAVGGNFYAAAPHGTGDLFSALFLGCYVQRHSAGEALSYATAATEMVVAASASRQSPELAIIEAQDAFLAPTVLPDLRRLD